MFHYCNTKALESYPYSNNMTGTNLHYLKWDNQLGACWVSGMHLTTTSLVPRLLSQKQNLEWKV